MNKIALVTGGSRGIGASICKKLALDGYFVYINYRSSSKNAEKLAYDINGKAIAFNVAERNEVKNAINRIIEESGKIDLLVNNAGISEISTFDSISENVADDIIDINLKGTLNCSRAALPFMLKEKNGSIINISSMWGQCGASCEVDYSTSKAGIIGFTKALAMETAPSNIRINCVAPGFILTDMNMRFSESELADILYDIPLGIFGKPEDVAEAVSFLASEKARFITGQTLAINGGSVMQ